MTQLGEGEEEDMEENLRMNHEARMVHKRQTADSHLRRNLKKNVQEHKVEEAM